MLPADDSPGLPAPWEEASKFLLLPVMGEDGDPHGAQLYGWLPPGQVIERNPLPELEPPYVQKPFLGRGIALQQLVLKLGQGTISRAQQNEMRLLTLSGLARRVYLATTIANWKSPSTTFWPST